MNAFNPARLGALALASFFLCSGALIPSSAEAATYTSKSEWRDALRSRLKSRNTQRQQRVWRERMSGGIHFEQYAGKTVENTTQKELKDQRRHEARKRVFGKLLGTKRLARKTEVARLRAAGSFNYETYIQ